MNATTKIYDMNDTELAFPFNGLTIVKPYNRNGSIFMRIELNGSPVYIQPPKCVLKQGLTKSGKKMFCDLVFSHQDETFLEWLEKLEETCYLNIFNNREKWFDPVLEKHEIEEYMTSPFKIIKSGKLFVIRADIPTSLGKCDLKVYDETETEINPETLKENTEVITIIEIKGIRCSVRNFQFELELKQMLVVHPIRIFEKCIINTHGNNRVVGIRNTSNLTNTEINRNDLGEQMENLEQNAINEEHDLFRNNEKNKEINDEQNTMDTVHNLTDATGANNINETNYLDLKIEDNKNSLGEHSATFSENIDNRKNENINTLMNSYNNGGDTTGHNSKVNDLVNNNNTNNTAEINPTEINNTILNKENAMEIQEVDIDLAQLNNVETMHLKKKNDIYYEKYKEAKQKAKEARLLALAHYMEARRIRTTYLEDIDLGDSDEDVEELGEENKHGLIE